MAAAAGKREISSFKPRKRRTSALQFDLMLVVGWLVVPTALLLLLCSTKVFALSGYLQFNIFLLTLAYACVLTTLVFLPSLLAMPV